MNRRYRLMAYGQWQPYVDADPVREHIEKLQTFGLGWMTIAALSGVPRGSVSKLIYGDAKRGMAPSKRVRPKTAAAILAIEPDMDVLPDGAMIEGTGTRRRLQALIANGWAQNRLAERLGMHRTNLNKMLLGHNYVRCGTARAVTMLYNDLWDQAPPQAEHRAKISANRARNYARDRGWPPPMAWDDDAIDDPAARAYLGAETPRDVALAENSEELVRQGFTLEQAAERLDVSRNYLDKARSRARSRRASEVAA